MRQLPWASSASRLAQLLMCIVGIAASGPMVQAQGGSEPGRAMAFSPNESSVENSLSTDTVPAISDVPPYQLVSCLACGQSASSCRCGVAHGGHAGHGGVLGHGGNSGLQFTNLYWCSPYGEVYEDYCDKNMCRDCGTSSPPTWYASVEMMALLRDQKDDLVMQTLGPGEIVALDTGDVDAEFDAGLRLTFGVSLNDLYRLEGTYLGAYEWDQSAATRDLSPNSQGGTGNLFSPFSNFGRPVAFIGADFNNFASIEMESKWDSVELNVRRRLIVPRYTWAPQRYCCVANSFSVGLRYMQLDERFGYVSSSSLPAGGSVIRSNTGTQNDLFGVQIGLQSQFLKRGQGWVDFEIKGGIYQNQASLSSTYRNTNGSGALLAQAQGTDSRDRTAFMGEISLMYNHNITSRLVCRVGYNAYWLSGVALASQNLETNIDLLSLGPPQLNDDGDVVYHGPSIGLVYAY